MPSAGQIIAKEKAAQLERRTAPLTAESDAVQSQPAAEVPLRRSPSPNRRALAGLRDPFRAISARHTQNGAPAEKPRRPPGIAGLAIGELRLRGLVEENVSHRVIAVVTGTGNLAYFLHERDQLYDGFVTRITPAALYLSRRDLTSSAGLNADPVVLRLEPDAGDKP